MATVLIKGEVSPVVRFGIRQHSNGALRASSPCHNRTMTGANLACRQCHIKWHKHADQDTWNYSVDVQIQAHSDFLTLRAWVRALTKYPEAEITVS